MSRRCLALLVLPLLVACGSSAVPEPPGVTVLGAGVERATAQADDADVRALARAQLELAIDVYAVLAAQSDDDVVLGPTSLHTALLMVRAGAAGRTATEMDDVLHLGGLGSADDAASALDAALRQRGEAEGVELGLANRVWVDRSVDLLEPYVERLTASYGAGLAELDIAGDPQGARRAVNDWAAARTLDRVPELMPDGSITAQTRVVLANALALDAAWQLPFDPDATTAAPFHLGDGSVRQVPTMHYGEYLPSGRGAGWTAVRLPYSGEQLSMTVVVPDDLAAFERTLSADLLDRVDGAIRDGGIHLSLPRFSAGSSHSLAVPLTELGMPSAFGADADFSPMTGGPDLALDAVEHEAVVTVDEEGTAAAAATGAAMMGSHGPTVTVDRPFLFVVRDEPTGAVLFLGRVTDPR